MPKRSGAIDAMPSAVLAHLRRLGEDLSIARKRRREPLKAWAQRVGVSEPTLMRMEKGDPSVSMGVYATALWLMGRSQALAEVADPAQDLGALRAQAALAVRRGHTSACRQFGLKKDEAVAQVRQVCAAVAGWRAHFEAAGVGAADLEVLAGQIDRPFLLGQRRALGG